MFAVIQAGGHQYRVQEGQTLTIDRIAGEAGDAVTFDKVFMICQEGANRIGAPMVEGARVEAVIKGQERLAKVLVFKYRRRKNSKKMRGHKQPITVVEIKKINA
jgi:large subunit ribosomal protein L21